MVSLFLIVSLNDPVLLTIKDHGNEWCAREPTKKVIFCFDKHSGYGGYSSATWGHGVRNFLFNGTDPKVGLQTWIRLEEGETRAWVVLDEKYGG